MPPLRRIHAAYDDQGIFVYQAFTPSIVAAALENGTFSTGFRMDRMTWIKPSFGWMLYRSGYAAKPHQEAILRIKLTHEGFRHILSDAVETHHNPATYPTREAWQQALQTSNVRLQWDPDRTLAGQQMERRAIQLGIRGVMVQRYVHEWIIGLEEVTGLVHAIRDAVDSKSPLPPVPEERLYSVSETLRRRLAMD